MRKKITCLLLAITLLLSFSYPEAVHAKSGSECNIYALYLGSEDKGDSTLIESKGHYLLIDIGSASHAPIIANQLSDLGINHVDIMFSHLHSDHAGGESADYTAGLKKLSELGIIIDTLYLPSPTIAPLSKSYPKKYEQYNLFMQNQGCGQMIYLNVGDQFQFGDVTADVIGPLNTQQLSPDMFTTLSSANDRRVRYENECSLATIFSCGDIRYFTAGDCYDIESNYLIEKYGTALNCDIMKLNHHGVGSGNSTALLKNISPAFSFIPNSGVDQKNTSTGKWRFYSALKHSSNYGMCYMVGVEEKTLIYHITNDKITLYKGSDILSGEKITGWQSLYGADGFNREQDMYYFTNDCKPLKGVHKIDHHYYYFRSGGQMDYGTYDEAGNYSGWKSYSSGTRYFQLSDDDTYAYMYNGLKEIEDNHYYFDNNGYKVVPDEGSIDLHPTQIGSNYYSIDSDGILALDSWEDINDKLYYCGSNGSMYRNCIRKIDGDYYIFEKDGSLVTSSKQTPRLYSFHKQTYAVRYDGSLICGKCVKINENKYYFNSTGAMQKDKIIKIGKNKFYFDSKGKMVKNKTITLKGKKYTCNKTGVLTYAKTPSKKK